MHHPTALIHQGAHIGTDVSIGPFAVIEDGVVIGDRCSIAAHAQILSGVIMGSDNHVDRAAILGGAPQSISFDTRIPSGVRIGDHNTFREHVTVHRSMHEAGQTSIGNANFLMATSHVGHDCTIGNRIVIANAALVAGHVDIDDHCFLGGGSAFHQFIRIGTYAMVQGNGSFSCDIPPFCTAFRENAVAGLNVVGLRRGGFDSAEDGDSMQIGVVLAVCGVDDCIRAEGVDCPGQRSAVAQVDGILRRIRWVVVVTRAYLPAEGVGSADEIRTEVAGSAGHIEAHGSSFTIMAGLSGRSADGR